ncbi:MAG: hypothetical protein JNG83_06255 [Opitutaceae bacterium]|nr:hypothetical protein [Opitutaceae bacterium]
MNNVEAKFILQAYRPNGADAGDATFGPALEQVRADPALREWLAHEQAFDAVLSAKLATVPVPAGLREAILAGARVTTPARPATGWWNQPAWLAAAACLAVLLAAGLAFWPRRAAAMETLAAQVAADAAHEAGHGGHGPGQNSLRAMLSDPSARLGGGLPVDFAALRDGGCRTLRLAGRDVLEVCFERNGVWYHCYIARRADFPQLAVSARPGFAERAGMSVASWADERHIYFIAGTAGRAAIERLL